METPSRLNGAGKNWRHLGLASALVMLTALAGCASNSGDPTIQNASWGNNGTSSSSSDSSSSGNGSDSTYQVRSGDTLYSIAWREKMSYTDLARINNIQAPYTLHVGQQLKLNENASTSSDTSSDSSSSQTHALSSESAPNTSSSSSSSDNSDNWLLSSNSSSSNSNSSNSNSSNSNAASSGTASGTSSSGSNTTSSTAAAGAAASQGTNSTQSSTSGNSQQQTASTSSSTQSPQANANRKYVPATTINWQWPTDGTIIGQYGQTHDLTSGIDIAGQKGQPVVAAGPGLVIYAGNGVRGYGNLIIIRHNDHYLSAYAHNASLSVKEGDVVVAGQQIATMGNTESSNVELHFEIRKDGKTVNPTDYLPKR